MLFIAGVITVIGCVLGGYVLHHGNLAVLWQPTEVLIICGAAAGSFMIANPGKIGIRALKSLKYLMKGTPFKKKDYVELLTLMYNCFKLMKSKGMLEMEGHIENPHESTLFSQYPGFIKNHHAVDFFCDYLRIMTMGMEDYYQMDDAMTRDLEVGHEESHKIAGAITNVADAMPALGIVAAVLGVIITMGSISEPPEILGKLIGAALVGTFLGVLLSYGFIAPMGNFLNAYFADDHRYLECIKVGLLSHIKGNAPAISVEFARNSIPSIERPDFATVDAALNNAGGGEASG
jgi:chemotaxis protein MotA